MRVALGIVGISFILFVVYDVVTTTLRVAGAGPLTSWVVDFLWKLALRLTPTHRSLAFVGFTIPLLTVSLWLGLDWLGWSLVLNLDPSAVVASSGGQPPVSRAAWTSRAPSSSPWATTTTAPSGTAGGW